MTSVEKTGLDFDQVAVRVHQISRDHGFWDKDRNLGEMLMLATSELAEALEEDRSDNPHVYFKCVECGLCYETLTTSGNCHGSPLKPEGALVEIIDCIIRCLDTAQDMAGKTRYTVAEVMDIKMTFNHRREHKHGKVY